jgi:hypothetical protein
MKIKLYDLVTVYGVKSGFNFGLHLIADVTEDGIVLFHVQSSNFHVLSNKKVTTKPLNYDQVKEKVARSKVTRVCNVYSEMNRRGEEWVGSLDGKPFVDKMRTKLTRFAKIGVFCDSDFDLNGRYLVLNTSKEHGALLFDCERFTMRVFSKADLAKCDCKFY